LVFYDVDPDNKDTFIEREEEMQVDEAWVRDEFNEEDVQHIIIMRLDDNWIQAPRDIEVWIGKQKMFVCVTLDLDSAASLTLMQLQSI
jgi:hypothetical protein